MAPVRIGAIFWYGWFLSTSSDSIKMYCKTISKLQGLFMPIINVGHPPALQAVAPARYRAGTSAAPALVSDTRASLRRLPVEMGVQWTGASRCDPSYCVALLAIRTSHQFEQAMKARSKDATREQTSRAGQGNPREEKFLPPWPFEGQ